MWPFKSKLPIQERATESGRVLAVTVVGQTVWALVNFEDYITNGYSKNPIVYSCVRLIAQMASATPFLLNGKALEEDKSALAVTLSQPNDAMSLPDLLDGLAVNLTIAGEAFLEGVTIRSQLREMAIMRPDMVKVAPAADGSVARYEFDNGSSRKVFDVPLPNGRGDAAFSRVCHMRMFHPTDAWRGHSPMLAAASAIMEHNGVGDYARALLKNAARPSGALVYAPKEGSQNLTDDQYSRLKTELEDNYQGAKNAGRPLLLEGGLSWVPMALTPAEMGASENRQNAAREIALALGVPPLLLGMKGDNTFANYREAKIALWYQNVKPLVGKIAARMTRWVQPIHFGSIITPDYQNAPISEEERAIAYERMKGADWVKIDEKRAATGLTPLDNGLGDVVLVGAGLAPLEDIVNADLVNPYDQKQ